MRIASHDDMPHLLQMGRDFHKEAAPEWPWDEIGFTQTMLQLIDHGFVMVSRKGFMAGVVSPMPFSPDWMIAHEILWWAKDGKGGKFFRAFRKWATENGANEIRWSCRSTNERVKRFYESFSRPCEAVYSEGITCVSQQ